ncbi:hypothetical protein CAPTEDRAFT_216204 [Capitella teleta]|uniref:G-protein coupled receptors family 1 profile domain-containing protein n=1 Tax=Capitella teleta TaxID=283909 RepID=R7V3P9_CAPTE|nr:hypothetical protein CAPTEDRAFT_216204 [Capitella teleta]|eukprot:ELU13478.1 hypothetical protein CAPTEDRAFT_216204 [Capitella teleta]
MAHNQTSTPMSEVSGSNWSETTPFANFSGQQSDELVWMRVYRKEIFSVSLAITLVGGLMNTIVMMLILLPHHFMSARSLLHLFLATNELISSLVTHPLYIITVYQQQWLFYGVGCHWFAFAFRLGGCHSNSTLAAMALERSIFAKEQCRSVGKKAELSRKSDHIDKKHRRYGLLMVLGVLVLSLLWCLPPLFGFSSFKLDNDRLTCLIAWDGHQLVNISYRIYYHTGALVLPAIIIVVCFVKYNRRVKIIELRLRHNRRSSSVVRLAMMVSRAPRTSLTLNPSTRRSVSSISSVVLRDTHIYLRESLSDDLRREERATYGMFALTSLSLALWLPVHVASFLATVFSSSLHRDLCMVCHLTPQLIAVITPTLIISFNKPCQDSLRRIVRSMFRRGTHATVTPLVTAREQNKDADHQFALNKIKEHESPLPPIEERLSGGGGAGGGGADKIAPKRKAPRHKVSIAINDCLVTPKKGLVTKNNTHV